MFGGITLKCRPLRLAFLIPPNKEALRNAIRINSTLWGGVFNPIIPLYARSPKAWTQDPGRKRSMKDHVAGYIRAFDPDFLVDCTGSQLPSYGANTGRSLISVDDIWSGFHSDRANTSPSYGVGIFEIAYGIYKEFFEAVRKYPVKVALPVLPVEHELFWAAVAGELPETMQWELEKRFTNALDIEKPKIGPDRYHAILKDYAFLPRHISGYQLKTGDPPARHSYAFYMDASSFADIVDFWNLRALGQTVLPVPKQFSDHPEYISLVRDYVQSRYRVHPRNPAVQHGTYMVRSYSSAMEELTAFAAKLLSNPVFPNKPAARVLALQHWYPRVWDEWAMGRDNATPQSVVSSKTEYEFAEAGDTIGFELLKPSFASEGYAATPRYANEVYPRFYGAGGKLLADVLPYDHGDAVLRAAGGLLGAGHDEFRIGRTGAIRLVKWPRSTRWTMPLAEDVFLAWLQDKGYHAELSTCGRLAKQMYTQLGGWINFLKHEPLLQLFDAMAKGGDEGRGLSLGQVKSRIANLGSPNKRLYELLAERNVFQLGYKTQCPHCGRRSWFSISVLANELTCPLCFKKTSAINAVDRANDGEWHLKTAGPFSVEKFADGAYAVLLTLNFFEYDFSRRMTPIMSFTAKRATDDFPLEADLGIMWQESDYGDDQEGILFAECKSYNAFEKKDFSRMETIAQKFPGAVLVFATLRRQLTAFEINEMTRIVRAGMKLWKADRPLNPVLVLTGHELFDDFGPPTCWEGLSIPDWTKRAHSLLETCNATQAVHLGLPHWQATWAAEYEKKRKRGETKRATTGDKA